MNFTAFRSTGTAAQHEFQKLPFIMNVIIFRSAGITAQHEFQELPFVMTVMIFRSAGTAAQPEFQEMPFIMHVRIFRSTGTAAQQSSFLHGLSCSTCNHGSSHGFQADLIYCSRTCEKKGVDGCESGVFPSH